MCLSHESRATFLPINYKLDVTLVQMETIQHRQIAFAGYAKSVGHALLNETLDQQMACQGRSCCGG
jgi:hypothetical protein